MCNTGVSQPWSDETNWFLNTEHMYLIWQLHFFLCFFHDQKMIVWAVFDCVLCNHTCLIPCYMLVNLVASVSCSSCSCAGGRVYDDGLETIRYGLSYLYGRLSKLSYPGWVVSTSNLWIDCSEWSGWRVPMHNRKKKNKCVCCFFFEL